MVQLRTQNPLITDEWMGTVWTWGWVKWFQEAAIGQYCGHAWLPIYLGIQGFERRLTCRICRETGQGGN